MSTHLNPDATSNAAYSGGSEDYGSASISGPGAGNKMASEGDSVDSSDTRFGTAHETRSYSGGTEYGSGTTAGPG